MNSQPTAPQLIMSTDAWRAAEAAHRERVDPLVAGHLSRRKDHRKHPIEDFLFVYYNNSPGKLRTYSPGVRVALLHDDAGRTPLTGHRFAKTIDTPDGFADVIDVEAFVAARDKTLTFVAALLRATQSRPAYLSCFGLHEWAMVYALRSGEQRHEQLPLRLGQAKTNAVVEASDIRCSHFDAYRFFTPDAVERNRVRPRRDTQVDFEQPGCLHAGMDIYKWAYKLFPVVPSELVVDAFELAMAIRVLDMEASPYDVRDLGYGVVPIETPRGRAEYVRRQREFSERTQELRARLLAVITALTTKVTI